MVLRQPASRNLRTSLPRKIISFCIIALHSSLRRLLFDFPILTSTTNLLAFYLKMGVLILIQALPLARH